MGARNDDSDNFDEAGDTLEDLMEEIIQLRMLLESQALRIQALEMALKHAVSPRTPSSADDKLPLVK